MSFLYSRATRVFAFQKYVASYSATIARRRQIRLLSATFLKPDEKIYEEFTWLSSEIRRHDDLYYNQQPQLGDEEYDALVRKENEISEQYPELLSKLQQESGLGRKATRSGRVGSSTSGKRIKRIHLKPMLSLDNVHDDEQLLAWLKRVNKVLQEETELKDDKVSILTEPKLDGVSLSLRYELNAEEKTYSLKWASTRGNGKEGQDVTQATWSIPNIPSCLCIHDNIEMKLAPEIEVRGEVVMFTKDFSRIASSQSLNFSNSRNAASGILLRKPSDQPEEQEVSQRLQSLLKFYAYDLVKEADKDSLDGIQNRNLLTEFGFSVAEPVTVTELPVNNATNEEVWTDADIGGILGYYKALEDHRQGKAQSSSSLQFLDFDMDGCVHKLVDPKLKRAMGRSMKSPKWAVAHKFPPLASITELIDVVVQVGRTGALTPVAVLKPVSVGGVNISRATLHNFGHLHEILGNEDSIPENTSVLVRRAGDVIPQVVGRIQSQETSPKSKDTLISLKTPKTCPACDSEVVWDEQSQPNNSSIGQVARCGGPPLLCPPRATTSLAHAYSRDALDISGLSEARIQQLMDAELLRLPCDIFNFSEEDWGKVEQLSGWGSKSVQNLRSSLKEAAKRGIALGRFVYALGIRQVGKHSSELVASTYGTKEAFLQAMDTATRWEEPQENEFVNGEAERDSDPHPFSRMQGRLGIGPVLINSLVSFSKNEEMVKAAKDLGDAVVVLEESTAEDSNALKALANDDKSKPFKGFRVVFTGSIANLTRSAAQKAAKELGAKATPGSVSKSTDLVVHGSSGGKKLQQALDFGIQTMTAEEFINLVEANDKQ